VRDGAADRRRAAGADEAVLDRQDGSQPSRGPVAVIARLTGRVQDPSPQRKPDLVLAGGRAPVAVPGVSVVALAHGRHIDCHSRLRQLESNRRVTRLPSSHCSPQLVLSTHPAHDPGSCRSTSRSNRRSFAGCHRTSRPPAGHDLCCHTPSACNSSRNPSRVTRLPSSHASHPATGYAPQTSGGSVWHVDEQPSHERTLPSHTALRDRGSHSPRPATSPSIILLATKLGSDPHSVPGPSTGVDDPGNWTGDRVRESG